MISTGSFIFHSSCISQQLNSSYASVNVKQLWGSLQTHLKNAFSGDGSVHSVVVFAAESQNETNCLKVKFPQLTSGELSLTILCLIRRSSVEQTIFQCSLSSLVVERILHNSQLVLLFACGSSVEQHRFLCICGAPKLVESFRSRILTAGRC